VFAYLPDPSVVAGVVGLQVLYWLCVDRYRDRFPGSTPVSPWRRFAFTLGLGFLLLALATPLDVVADQYLFSVHMLQHLLITLATAPLLIVGTPGWLLRATLEATHLTRAARWALKPLIAYGLFNLIFSAAHIPAFYELTLHNDLLHAVEHLVFLVTAIIMFMPVLSPLPDVLPRYHGLVQVLYLFLQTLPAALVGALLALASAPYYPTYVLAPRVTILSPLEDQQLGGLLMWVGTGFYFLIATGIVFFAWASREEAANRRPIHA
jgi:cytochrome c oxidase assembly factor CtaG